MGCIHQMSMIDWLSPVYISLPLMCRDFINFITPCQAGYLRWRWHLYRGQCEPCTQDVHLCLSYTSCFACRICISVAQKRTSPAHWCTCFLISEHGVGYAKKLVAVVHASNSKTVKLWNSKSINTWHLCCGATFLECFRSSQVSKSAGSHFFNQTSPLVQLIEAWASKLTCATVQQGRTRSNKVANQQLTVDLRHHAT